LFLPSAHGNRDAAGSAQIAHPVDLAHSAHTQGSATPGRLTRDWIDPSRAQDDIGPERYRNVRYGERASRARLAEPGEYTVQKCQEKLHVGGAPHSRVTGRRLHLHHGHLVSTAKDVDDTSRTVVTLRVVCEGRTWVVDF
jgi:hypothetical protein